MIRFCKLCGGWTDVEPGSYKWREYVCGPCSWQLRPGDIVVCKHAENSERLLRPFGLHQVWKVDMRDGQVLVWVEPWAIGWPWTRFHFVGRSLENGDQGAISGDKDQVGV